MSYSFLFVTGPLHDNRLNSIKNYFYIGEFKKYIIYINQLYFLPVQRYGNFAEAAATKIQRS